MRRRTPGRAPLEIFDPPLHFIFMHYVVHQRQVPYHVAEGVLPLRVESNPEVRRVSSCMPEEVRIVCNDYALFAFGKRDVVLIWCA